MCCCACLFACVPSLELRVRAVVPALLVCLRWSCVCVRVGFVPQEPRHAYGMRRLGIPNTKHFHDVTSIKDALGLYQKLRTEIESEVWKPDVEEEFEDTEGNVMSRKVRERGYEAACLQPL